MFIFIQRAALIQISLLSTICPVIPPPSKSKWRWSSGASDCMIFIHLLACPHSHTIIIITRSLFQEEQRPVDGKQHQHFTQTAAHQDWIMLKVSWALNFCHNTKTKWSSKHCSHSATLQHYVTAPINVFLQYPHLFFAAISAKHRSLSADTFILNNFFCLRSFIFIVILFISHDR